MHYWHWNRERFLPLPPRGPAALQWAEPTGRADVTTAASDADRVAGTWLLAALDSADPLDRAGAAYALGRAGDLEHGIQGLLARLDDPVSAVREAAALGLGELGGARARFALVHVLADAGRDERLRSLAALGLGVAARREGVFPGAELRRAAQTSDGLPMLREAICAAVVLARSDCLEETAADWLALPIGSHPPATAVPCALGWTAADLPERVRPWLTASATELRLAALASAVQMTDWAPGGLAKLVLRPAPDDSAMALLVAASWPLYACVAMEIPATLRGVHGFGLALNAREPDPRSMPAVTTWLRVGVVEREDHLAEARPLWLLTAGLAGDPAAEARARTAWQGTGSLALQAMALETLALIGGTAMQPVRGAVTLAGDPELRALAADLCARSGAPEDVLVLRHALATAVVDAERARLLVALGRSHAAGAGAILRSFAARRAEHGLVRQAAWLGLAHWLANGREQALTELAVRGGHAWLPPWLLDVITAVR